MEYVYLVWEPE